MLARYLAYLILGWLLLALIPGVGHGLGVTLMLPASSAVLLVHFAFAKATRGQFIWLLALGASLGYLEDLHQGTAVGLTMLAYECAAMALFWCSKRVDLHGWFARAACCASLVFFVDLLMWFVLLLSAEQMGFDSSGLHASMWAARWHWLATALLTFPLWLGCDLAMNLRARLAGGWRQKGLRGQVFR